MFVFANIFSKTTKYFEDFWVWSSTHHRWEWVCRSPVYSEENPGMPGCPLPGCGLYPATGGAAEDFEKHCGPLSAYSGRYVGQEAWHYIPGRGWLREFFYYWRVP